MFTCREIVCHNIFFLFFREGKFLEFFRVQYIFKSWKERRREICLGLWPQFFVQKWVETFMHNRVEKTDLSDFLSLMSHTRYAGMSSTYPSTIPSKDLAWPGVFLPSLLSGGIKQVTCVPKSTKCFKLKSIFLPSKISLGDLKIILPFSSSTSIRGIIFRVKIKCLAASPHSLGGAPL